jgi:hypothetical protein
MRIPICQAVFLDGFGELAVAFDRRAANAMLIS